MATDSEPKYKNGEYLLSRRWFNFSFLFFQRYFSILKDFGNKERNKVGTGEEKNPNLGERRVRDDPHVEGF